jgi:hypothetical protein
MRRVTPALSQLLLVVVVTAVPYSSSRELVSLAQEAMFVC